MSVKEYVFVVNNGLPHQPDAEENIYVVNLGGHDSSSAQKTVVVLNRMRGSRPSGYKNVRVVNDGMPHPFGGSSVDSYVYVENLDDLPVNIKVAWELLRCPRCSGRLKDFGYEYGCDRCRITFRGWEHERF
jgi:hypothetical protein